MVVIVEDDDELLLDVFENFVQQHIGGALRLLREFIRLQVREDRFTEIRHPLLNSLREISKKHRRIAICVIELIPDVRPFLLSQEISHQSRLARTGVRGDQRYRQRQVRVQPFDQTFAEQQFRRRSWRQQFGAQKERARRGEHRCWCGWRYSFGVFAFAFGHDDLRSKLSGTLAESSTAKSTTSIVGNARDEIVAIPGDATRHGGSVH
jgi:hypothetical protein